MSIGQHTTPEANTVFVVEAHIATLSSIINLESECEYVSKLITAEHINEGLSSDRSKFTVMRVTLVVIFKSGAGNIYTVGKCVTAFIHSVDHTSVGLDPFAAAVHITELIKLLL